MLRIYKLLYITAFFFLFITATKIIAIFIKNKDFAYFFHKKTNISWKTVVPHLYNYSAAGTAHEKNRKKTANLFHFAKITYICN